MSAVNGFVEQLHPQIAPPVPSFNVHLIPPERDEFGLPIRHFARDLDRLRRQVKQTTGVVLVTLDSLFRLTPLRRRRTRDQRPSSSDRGIKSVRGRE